MAFWNLDTSPQGEGGGGGERNILVKMQNLFHNNTVQSTTVILKLFLTLFTCMSEAVPPNLLCREKLPQHPPSRLSHPSLLTLT